MHRRRDRRRRWKKWARNLLWVSTKFAKFTKAALFLDRGLYSIEYGTHYATEAQMGSSLIFESRFDKLDMENTTEEERNKCHKIQGAKILGIQVEKDSNDCKFNSTNGEKTSSQSVDRFQQKSKGSFPPIDREGDGALSEWNSKVQEEVGEGKYKYLLTGQNRLKK